MGGGALCRYATSWPDWSWLQIWLKSCNKWLNCHSSVKHLRHHRHHPPPLKRIQRAPRRKRRRAQGTPYSWTRLARNSGITANHSSGEKSVHAGRFRSRRVAITLCALTRTPQRTSYLTQHRRGHSGDAVHGWTAVHLQAREAGLHPGVLVVQLQPVRPAGGRGHHGQPGQQQQRGLGQSGLPQPRSRLPVWWPFNVSTPAPFQETRPQPSTYQQSGHKRWEFDSVRLFFFLYFVCWDVFIIISIINIVFFILHRIHWDVL